MAMKLALGPLLYYWPRETVLDFYRQVTRWPVDIVYLGEVVCAKRHSLRLDDWINIARMLQQAGKQVVLSTLALIEAESELSALRRIVRNGEYSVEANDMAAVQLLMGTNYIAGPHLNIYNPASLALHHELGAQRWVMPVELPLPTLREMQHNKPPAMQTEIFVFGRLPLAFSARCFTARACNLPKDNCQFRCADYPDGLVMHTREKLPFLVINGIQTQSATTYNLAGVIPTLAELQIDVLRVSPQSQNMERILELFRMVMDNSISPHSAEENINALAVGAPSNGYWHGDPGMQWRSADNLKMPFSAIPEK